MLSFRRRVVAALLTTVEPQHRPAAKAYVEGALDAMPDHLKLGVAADSLLLSAWARARAGRGPLTDDDLKALITQWDSSRIPPVRQYARLLGSLVLFAQNEATGADEVAAA